jgi:hypothetical protein
MEFLYSIRLLFSSFRPSGKEYSQNISQNTQTSLIVRAGWVMRVGPKQPKLPPPPKHFREWATARVRLYIIENEKEEFDD